MRHTLTIVTESILKGVGKMATKKKKTSKVKRTEFKPKSFQIAANPKPFVTFKITQQTIYWLILLAFITFFTLWILKLQIDVTNILNSLELQK